MYVYTYIYIYIYIVQIINTSTHTACERKHPFQEDQGRAVRDMQRGPDHTEISVICELLSESRSERYPL